MRAIESSPVVREVEAFLEEVRQVRLRIPVGIAHSLVRVLVVQCYKRHNCPEEDEIWDIVRNIDAVVPNELVLKGRENYRGDLNKEVELVLSRKDIRTIGGALFPSSESEAFVVLQTVFASAQGK